MADAGDSKSPDSNIMRVQVPPSAPYKNNPNQSKVSSDFLFVKSFLQKLFINHLRR